MVERRHVGRTVRREIAIRATPAEVYAAWADPQRIARWFVDAASGACEAGSVMTWCFDSMGFEMPVPIVEAVPGKRIAIAGEVPGRPPFLQEVDLEATADGTRLRLANSGFGDGPEWDDELAGVESGWALALATLKHVLEEHPTGRREHRFRMRPARFEYDALRELYFTPDGLASWLADRARSKEAELREGSELELELGALGRLSGRVLAATPRELLASWPERGGVLALKAFALPPEGRAVALDFNAWGRGGESAGVEAGLERALERLTARLATESA